MFKPLVIAIFVSANIQWEADLEIWAWGLFITN